MNAVITAHRLDFYHALWEPSEISQMLLDSLPNDDEWPDIPWAVFKVGTCQGQYRKTPEAYEILSIINDCPGNGHLEDLFQWFEYACRRSRLPLRMLRFTNDRFMQHLIEKHGFRMISDEDLEKTFT